MTDSKFDILKYIDHTNLKPDATEIDIQQLCLETVEYNFYSVCINPIWVSFAKQQLANSQIKICTVAGFPLGANRTDIKLEESIKAVADGAHEIDMVANISWLKSGRFSDAEKEIAEIRKKIPFNIVLKVIVEGSKLSDNELVEAAKTVENGGAQFVKTSTGFFSGATVEMVRILKETVADRIEIKAAGGIRTLTDCEAMIQAGATRVGCSASVDIAKQLMAQEDK